MLRIALAFFVGAGLTALAYTLIPLFSTVPPSPLISAAAQQALEGVREDISPHLADFLTGDVATQRAILDEHFYGPRITTARSLYAVDEAPLEIDGVYTEVFTPAAGVPADNADRVLINQAARRAPGHPDLPRRQRGRGHRLPAPATALRP